MLGEVLQSENVLDTEKSVESSEYGEKVSLSHVLAYCTSSVMV